MNIKKGSHTYHPRAGVASAGFVCFTIEIMAAGGGDDDDKEEMPGGRYSDDIVDYHYGAVQPPTLAGLIGSSCAYRIAQDIPGGERIVEIQIGTSYMFEHGCF